MLREHRGWLVRQAVVWGVGAAVLRLVVVPAETCPSVDAATVRSAIDEGAAWLERGLREDGRFVYGYSSDTGEISSDYNNTRHAGVLEALYRVGRIRAGDAGLRYVRDNLIRHDGWAAFAVPGEWANVGTNSLLIAALVDRRRQTGDARYDELARRLMRFVVEQQRPDGSILQYWRPDTERSVPGVFGKFSTGEALFALALMHATFPGEGWERPAHRVATYLATRRDRAEGFSLRQWDHWAAYGLDELAPAGLTDVEVDYARFQAGYFGYLVRFESQWTGRPLSPFSQSGAELGTIGEGTAALWRLAGKEPRLADLRDQLGDRVTCLAGINAERQVGPANPNPLERGAWFADGYTQMDDQQHAIAALFGASEVLR